MAGDALLAVDGLVRHFVAERTLLGRPRAWIRAVDGVSLSLGQREILGLVGESGCGKTTLGRCVARLDEPTAGSIRFAGIDVRNLRGRPLRRWRRQVQTIFQDPYSSLNPRKRVEQIIGDGLAIHGLGDRRARRERVAALLAEVGLQPEHLARYPHEFSGGQRQRIVIARALALEPKLVIADEPVAALDVSVQAQIVNLMLRLQASFGLSYLFISHDLGLVRHLCDRVAVMYLGRVVETGDTRNIFARPLHPYTRALIDSVPRPNPALRGRRAPLEGEVPSAIDLPRGCPFQPRCANRQPICGERRPELEERGDGRSVACHHPLDAG